MALISAAATGEASAVASAASSRRFKVVKAWLQAEKQAARGSGSMTYVNIIEGEIVTVEEAINENHMVESTWVEVVLADGKRGLVPTKTSKGELRLQELVEAAAPEEVVSSDAEMSDSQGMAPSPSPERSATEEAPADGDAAAPDAAEAVEPPATPAVA